MTASPQSDDRLTGALTEVDTPESAFDFLVGMLLTHGQRAERAWRGPAALKARLGVGPSLLTHDLDAETLARVLAHSPSLARFPRRAAEAIERLAGHVRSRLGGDARKLWAGSSPAEAEARLRQVPGFANKRAVVATYLLATQFRQLEADDEMVRAAEQACQTLGAAGPR